MAERARVAVLGGGTGTFTVLMGLKRHAIDLSAIVSIADSGGSTGILRDELGVLPPGDLRQALVALARGDDILRRLFIYRFHEGSLAGHNFGNLFLSALEKVTGDSLSAIREAQRILEVRGRVIPVSAQAAELYAELEDGTVLVREHAIDETVAQRSPIRRCFLSPSVSANPEALDAIREADLIVLGPGDLFTSIIPVLLVKGVAEALAECRGKLVFVLNLTTKRGQTEGYVATDFCRMLAAHIGRARINVVLANQGTPSPGLIERYARAGEPLVQDDLEGSDWACVHRSLLSDEIPGLVPGDHPRSLLRHDPAKLADALLQLI